MTEEATKALYEWFGFVASDNLPNRSGMRTPLEGLRRLARLMIHTPATANHGTFGVSGNFGRVVDGDIFSLPTPAGLQDWELAAIADEGYHQLILGVAVEQGHPEIEELKSMRHSECSIAFGYDRLACPSCTCGKDLYACTSRDLPRYFERLEVTDGLEFSLVVVGAVRRARLIKIRS